MSTTKEQVEKRASIEVAHTVARIIVEKSSGIDHNYAMHEAICLQLDALKAESAELRRMFSRSQQTPAQFRQQVLEELKAERNAARNGDDRMKLNDRIADLAKDL